MPVALRPWSWLICYGMHSWNHSSTAILGGLASLSPDTQIELLVSSWLHIYCELPRLAVTWFGIKSHYLQQPWLMRVDVFVTYERDNSPRSQDVCYPPPLHPPPPKKKNKKPKRNPTMTTERYKAARNAWGNVGEAFCTHCHCHYPIAVCVGILCSNLLITFYWHIADSRGNRFPFLNWPN